MLLLDFHAVDDADGSRAAEVSVSRPRDGLGEHGRRLPVPDGTGCMQRGARGQSGGSSALCAASREKVTAAWLPPMVMAATGQRAAEHPGCGRGSNTIWGGRYFIYRPPLGVINRWIRPDRPRLVRAYRGPSPRGRPRHAPVAARRAAARMPAAATELVVAATSTYGPARRRWWRG